MNHSQSMMKNLTFLPIPMKAIVLQTSYSSYLKVKKKDIRSRSQKHLRLKFGQ